MVHTAMLVLLGFLLATLVSLLLAPVVWRRAARLATDRLKEGLPISLTDFHADKDQLRAKHAISIRNLEMELDRAKDRTAELMVESGRQKGENMSLTTQIRDLRAALSERKSLISVMEQTLNANVPRMKERLQSEIGAKNELSDTVVALEGTLKKTTQELEKADQGIRVQEAEIQKLRQAVGIKPQLGAFFPASRSRKGAGVATVLEEENIDLAALDLKEGGKGAQIVQALQEENRQLHEVISQTKDQLEKAKRFEAKEVPLLRKELRQLGTEVLRSVEVPKVEASATEGKKKLSGLASLKTARREKTAPEVRKVKQSLAERLKGVAKLGPEVDA